MKKSINADSGKSYSELLKDPRWQKKRLQIMKRDKFTCRACDRNEKTLHVHHTYYDKDLLPWEYKNTDLVTLCETCHKVWTLLDRMIKANDFGWEHVCTIIHLFNQLEQEDFERFMRKRERIKAKENKDNHSPDPF